MTKTELAKRVGVTVAAITQYELAQSKPSVDVAARIALGLGLPLEFFEPGKPAPETDSTLAHFRSLRSTTQRERDQAIAFGHLAYEVLTAIEAHVDLPVARLPCLQLPEQLAPADVTNAARETRVVMKVPAGPIANVVRLLEAHGVLVLRLPEMSRRVDAFSHRYGERPAAFLSPTKADRARGRFDASHELGHLVMHHDADPGTRPVENQAHAFAAEFLMPAVEVEQDLPRKLDWEQLHEAKRRWGTSLKALLYRAHVLRIVTEHTYKRGMMQLAEWGDPEPGQLGPAESPTMIGAAVQLVSSVGIKLADLADQAGLPTSIVEVVVASGSDPRPVVRL